MKLYTLTRRFTAAVLTAAMALSFCAPALAEAPSAAADPAAPAATASTAENSTADTIVFDKLYFGTQEDWDWTIVGAPSGDVVLQYTAANRTLTVTGTYFGALTISAPGVNVVLNGTTGPAVMGDLNITASASVTITSSAAGAQAVTGNTNITSDGAVSITGADRAVGGENLTVNAGGDVTIVGGCEGASIWRSANITTTGSVTLKTTNSGGWAQGTAGTGVLTVDAGSDVTITGGTASQPTINGAIIRCGGEFELRNPLGGRILPDTVSGSSDVGILNYINTNPTAEVVVRSSQDGDSCFPCGFKQGPIYGGNEDLTWFTAKYEQSYALNLTDCTLEDSAQGRTVFYAGEEVRLVLKRPVYGTTFTDWTVTKEDGTAVKFNRKGDSIRFTMPDSAVKATANWDRATEPGLWLSTERGPIMVTADLLEAAPISGITYEDGAFIVDKIIAAETLRVLGLAPTEDELPDVVLKGLTVDTLIVDGVRDVTLDACHIGELVDLDHIDAVYSLQITNARDVVLKDTSIRYSDLSGVRNVTAKADGKLCDRLNIDCTGDIALSTAADTLGVACYLQAGGSIRLTGAPWKTLMVHSAQNVTVDANALPQHASFTCSGIVDVSQRDGSAIDSGSPWYLLEYYPETEQPYVVTLNGETGEVRSDSYQLNNLDDLRAVQHLLITPASLLPDDVDSDAVGQFITDASGVLVSAALAGAAVWGGYEVTTRVMLKNLLPEGTAIPATRGELAQLLWNAAGRPEAGAVVTVYPDITDADQQAAARWCTEQGLLTARSDGTFAPDGRVPKWRVIEVWNHAFAK